MNTSDPLTISFCTVCKNRLFHLKETLLQNIEDNKYFKNLEFIVLDYNSEDGLDSWIKSNCSNLIAADRLIYFKNNEHDYFNRSHSRNLVFKLASGKILCNIDADNFTGVNFAQLVASVFETKERVFFAPDVNSKDTLTDAYGRICLRKEDFMDIDGFDESMSGHGFEDLDMINRLEKYGLHKICIPSKIFLRAISHGDEHRISNEILFRNLDCIYLRYIDFTKSELIFINKDKTFHIGIILDNYAVDSADYKSMMTTSKPAYEYSLNNSSWEFGNWLEDADRLTLIFDKNDMIFNKELDKIRLSTKPDLIFYKLSDPAMIYQLILFNSQIYNRRKMEQNLQTLENKINKMQFGKGVVFKNFENLRAINVY